MKINKLYLLALVWFFCINYQVAQTNYSWEYVSSLQNENLRKIFTLGIDTVFVVGENGLIARSCDKTLTWNKKYYATTKLNDIIFCNHNTGFAVGDKGVILKTIDAGNSWVQINSGTTENINAIATSNQDIIWIVGSNSLVMKSVDTGNNWTKENILSESKRELLDIKFHNSIGYITGNYATVYTTQNTGNSWNKYSLADITDQFVTINSISFTENNVYMVYDFSRTLLSKENNNDASWIVKNSPTRQGRIFFFNDSTGYFLGIFPPPTDGSGYPFIGISKTTNGAIDWHWQTYNFDLQQPKRIIDANQIDISFSNDSTGYILFDKALFKTQSLLTGSKIPPRIDSNKGIYLFPNSEIIQVFSDNNDIKSIEMIDIYGKKCKVPILENNIIDVSNVVSGIYLVKVRLLNNSTEIIKYVKH
jgi:photosystem II stability/assembly factor-like uncharacterized protein